VFFVVSLSRDAPPRLSPDETRQGKAAHSDPHVPCLLPSATPPRSPLWQQAAEAVIIDDSVQIDSGTRLGVYEITSFLGSGGMGEVYRGRDERIGRDVAIKLLPESLTADPDRMRRFEQEARAAGSLNHPNLVTLHDLGSQNERPYLVMELLEGQNLREKLGTGGVRLSVRKATEYAVQIAQGLAAAHEKGVVHRDLKPENIFITRDGRVKILDFGLAKLQPGVDEVTEGSRTVEFHDETRPGTVLGTAGYMAPEQVRGERVDQRADLFSFGAIVYEMLTGQRAFRRPSSVETMNAVLNEDPPDVSDTGAHIPAALERIVRRCLEKNPEERFHSAHDLALVLESLSVASDASTADGVRVGGKRRLPAWVALALVALIAAAVASVATWGVTHDTARPQAELRYTPLTQQKGADVFPSLSPDGKTFIFASDRSGVMEIYLQRVDGRNAINLTNNPSAADSQPAFSPDGERIAFRSERDGGGIFIMGATGETVRRLTDFGYNPSWSPDGTQLVIASESVVLNPASRSARSRLHLVDVRSGTSHVIEVDGVQPAFSPDGKRIVFWMIHGPSQRDIATVGVEGGEVVLLTDDAALDWNPVWSRDGRTVYFGSDRGGTTGLWRIAIDPKNGKPRGTPQSVPLPSRFAGHFSFSADGSQFTYTSLDERDVVERIGVDLGKGIFTGAPSRVLDGTLIVYSFDISPDGEWLIMSNRGPQENLYLVRTDGSEIRQITNDAFKDRGPSWSPDGREIYFYTTRAGRFEVWKIRPDGSGAQQITRTSKTSPWYPRVSPDQTKLVFYNEQGSSLVDLTKESAEPEPLPPLSPTTRFAGASWSPDGHRIAGWRATFDAVTVPGVVLYSLADRAYSVVSEEGLRGQWTPDGRVILINSKGNVALLNVDTGEMHELSAPAGFDTRPMIENTFNRFVLSPDGRSLFYSYKNAETDIWLASTAAR
jgi:eukaryotic-like serine/threonine-protein kinase